MGVLVYESLFSGMMGKPGGIAEPGADMQYGLEGRPKPQRALDPWEVGMETGFGKGRELFRDDPDMQSIRAKREDLAKGYSGEALGAMREQARGEMAGARQNYLQQLAGKAARGGIGGARAAAMQGAADVGLQGKQAELERKMALDQAKQVTEGTQSLQDFLLKQRFGELSTGIGYGQMASAKYAADRAQAANQGSGGGLGQILDLGFANAVTAPFSGIGKALGWG